MKFQTRLRCQTIVVLCYAVLSSAEDNDESLTKLWSLSSASNSDGSAVVNVTSASIVIPTAYRSNPIQARTSRVTKFTPYAFRPRAIPLKRVEETPQEKNVYYTQDNKYKTEILFPGNYFAIPKEKSTEMKEPAYNPLSGGAFEPQAIPLIRSQGPEKRSLDLDSVEYKDQTQGEALSQGPEKRYLDTMDYKDQTQDDQEQQQQQQQQIPKDDEEQYESQETPLLQSLASRRSLSYILGAEDEEDSEDDEEGEYETEEDAAKGPHIGHKIRHKLKKAKKYSKYMMPLLLAYKMKYFALVPVMIGGLILLVGATGMAGFFFALFAAVMGLQKGGY